MQNEDSDNNYQQSAIINSVQQTNNINHVDYENATSENNRDLLEIHDVSQQQSDSLSETSSSSLTDSDIEIISISPKERRIKQAKIINKIFNFNVPKTKDLSIKEWLYKCIKTSSKKSEISILLGEKLREKHGHSIKVMKSDFEEIHLIVEENIMEMENFSNKKFFFYEKLYPNIKKVMKTEMIQRCYGIAPADEHMRVLALEGFEYGNSENLDFSDIKAAAEQLGEFHALGFTLQSDLSRLYPDVNKVIHTYSNLSLQKAGMQCIEYMKQYGLEEKYLDHLTNYVLSNCLEDKINKLSQPQQPIATLCHGNLSVRNFSIQSSENQWPRVIFTNLEFCFYGHPVLDMIQLLYTNISREQRKVHLIYLVFIHYRSLLKDLDNLGVKLPSHYSFSDYLQDFSARKEYGFLSCLIAFIPKLKDANSEDFKRRDWRGNINKEVRNALQKIYDVILDMWDSDRD